MSCSSPRFRSHFNPRSPHGERPSFCRDRARLDLISTHAPRTGSDQPFVPHYLAHPISTHAPRTGSDAIQFGALYKALKFQPTLPARGATKQAGIQQRVQRISTHAPRTGSDRRGPFRLPPASDGFQPTLPARGATPSPPAGKAFKGISTHAPRTGSDQTMGNALNGSNISTHAPRTGSDVPSFRRVARLDLDFNPRSPHGERPPASGRGRRCSGISTHAPRTGSDPAIGETVVITKHISTHAPRTGSDGSPPLFAPQRREFQPTLPARGATTSMCVPCRRTHFNPRSPHGERQRKVTILSIRIIGFAQKVYHKTVLLRISLAENAVILPKRPQNPVRTSLQKAGGLRFARAIRAARPYSISSPSGA